MTVLLIRISPPVGQGILEKNKSESGLDNANIPANAQYFYTEEDKKTFSGDPAKFLEYRKALEVEINIGFDMFILGSETSKMAQQAIKEEMYRRIGPGHEELKEKLIPTWPPGCKFFITTCIHLQTNTFFLCQADE